MTRRSPEVRCRHGRGAALAAWLLGAALVAMPAAAAPADPAPLVVREAQRLRAGAPPEPVTLPQLLPVGDSGAATFRFSANLGPRPSGLGLLLPDVKGEVTLRVNGHALPGVPAGSEKLPLWPLPDEYLQAGANAFELRIRGTGRLELPEVRIGTLRALGLQRERLVFASHTGPILVAVVIGSSGMGVLLLFLRRRSETVYGYFGFGALLWSLHSLWTVLSPSLQLPAPHQVVWWNASFMLYVAMLVIFCLRFTRGLAPWLERGLWLLALAGPALLYAAVPFGRLASAAASWRLTWIAVVLAALGVVARHAVRERSRESLMLLVTGGIGAAFGIHDWVQNTIRRDLASVQLTPYAGLFFIVLVAWILMDRFVRTTEALEAMNRELEQRVTRQNEQLFEALDAMRLAKESAEAANRAKGSFLASASHDLRQPIHALGLYLSALQSGPLDPAQAELVSRMHGSAAALQAMFDALLDISRMDAGAVRPRPRAVALAPLLHRLAEEFAPLAADQGLRLSVRLSNRAGALRAVTDPLLLERVLRNLLANAVKYTPAGGVLLTARLRASAASPRWCIAVWDTGVGIADAEQERVFEEFHQVGNPERDRSNGLGLGLSIVRRVCELMQHPLTLDSVPGRGTRFSVDLAATRDAPAQDAIVTALEGSLKAVAVAVVEDDPEVRAAMRTLLARWGCTVLEGASVGELRERFGLAELSRVRAVVADYRLRDAHTGAEAIAELRQALWRAVPALIVSGDSGADRLAQMQVSGHAWLPKPVPAARLRSWLLQAVVAEPAEATG